MTIRKVYIGSLGPVLYDDTVALEDPDFVGVPRAAIVTNGELYVSTSEGDDALNVATISGNTTLTSSNRIVYCNAASGSFSVTLPSVSDLNGIILYIKKIDSSVNTVSILPASGNIDGESDYVLELEYEFVQITSDGLVYYVIGE